MSFIEGSNLSVEAVHIQAVHSSPAHDSNFYSKHMNKLGVEHDENAKKLVDVKYENGDTLLITAARNGHFNICNYLLKEKKADIDVRRDMDKTTALMIAAETDNDNIVELLLKHNANVNAQDIWHRTALWKAAKGNRRTPVVRLLIKHGADAGWM